MKKNKKELSDNKRIGLFVAVIIIVISLIGVSSYLVLKNHDSNPKPQEVKIENEISEYGITLDSKATLLYKEEFNKLKDNLTSKNVDYDEYAESVAKLFIIDLYTINNKINKYDVGGLEFVEPSIKDNYVANVTDTIYKYVEDNADGKRNQELPEVKSISVEKEEKTKYKINSLNKEYDAYKFNITWEYVNDYQYDKTGEVIVVNIDNKMYVVEKN